MEKFILVPDSFKGTMSSNEVCKVMQSAITKFYPNAKIVSIPVADGGEGSVDCFLTAVGGSKRYCQCANPFFEKMQAFYGVLADKTTAFIEMSASAGLPLVEERKNPLLATTYGVGELILDAVKNGAKKIIMGLGGSCTNDFGCGCAAACGVKFYDDKGKEFIPTGGTLLNVYSIDVSSIDKRLEGVEIISMCDIDNPPYGEFGAARVFSPQKGAGETEVILLDKGVKHLCEKVKTCLGKDLSNLAGGGSAGAMGAGMVAFFNSTLKMGIQTVLDTVGFDDVVKDADIVFTGEGKIDSQSLRGKVVIGVSQRAKEKGVPVIAVVGGSDGDMQKAYEKGVTAIFSINRMPQDLSVSKKFSKQNLQFAMENILRTIKNTNKN